ncbi:winged helix-turn-helix transcriptional regulator [Kibdelosporangium phytohabitans]|uniref:HxlR family transcriptional regulator n=1 Tax=Kibdelosporangium phytohabitans TaxID=860235 RepID=A0A0N9HQ21_9PSEU|nr:helix-turn-helix domain-containing protein [Kibdelosporangium phytohabitans]ALG06776.1 HxlR family transcriptional regulator [Kibdelosporangium phytohabitans]MBE1468012.1 DNA-binding HxlR family transcriptional regulator [Kibdelosporangium phytohabitans]
MLIADCPARLAFDIVSNTWNAVVIWALKDGPLRHSELRRRIGGISAKVLTETLRRLTDYGLVRPAYELTALGRTMLGPIEAMGKWAHEHGPDVSVVR